MMVVKALGLCLTLQLCWCMLTTNIEGKNPTHPNPASTAIKPSTQLPSQDIFAPPHPCFFCSSQIMSILYNYPKAPVSATVGGKRAIHEPGWLLISPTNPRSNGANHGLIVRSLTCLSFSSTQHLAHISLLVLCNQPLTCLERTGQIMTLSTARCKNVFRRGIMQSREKAFSKAVIVLHTALLIAAWRNTKTK